MEIILGDKQGENMVKKRCFRLNRKN